MSECPRSGASFVSIKKESFYDPEGKREKNLQASVLLIISWQMDITQ